MALDWIDLNGGRARFSGLSLGVDELAHDTFQIEVQSKPALYGEYRAAWANNENDFDIEIVSFGFATDRNVGNDHPDARHRFSWGECENIERLTICLITSDGAQKGLPLFSSTKGRFLGRVKFAPGWIVLNE